LLTEKVTAKSHTEWLKEFEVRLEKETRLLIEPELNPTTEKMTMGEVIKTLNELTNGEAVIVTDVGQHQMIACRYAAQLKTRSNITSGGLGTMGFALPAAIGAKYGAPERTVVAIMGDAGAQMNIQELGTIMQFQPNVKILILNNHFLGMVRQWQELFHEKRYSFTDIQSPDFVQVAKGYGIDGAQISDRKDLKASLAKMLAYPKSFLLEIDVAHEDNVFPMVPQGFGNLKKRNGRRAYTKFDAFGRRKWHGLDVCQYFRNGSKGRARLERQIPRRYYPTFRAIIRRSFIWQRSQKSHYRRQQSRLQSHFGRRIERNTRIRALAHRCRSQKIKT
jgi:thiamine pyrophosphate-dependent acetolactate synthase large subunit-like protein